jgi:hypothetical protein
MAPRMEQRPVESCALARLAARRSGEIEIGIGGLFGHKGNSWLED